MVSMPSQGPTVVATCLLILLCNRNVVMWCSITRISDWNWKDFVPSLQRAGLANKRKEQDV